MTTKNCISIVVIITIAMVVLSSCNPHVGSKTFHPVKFRMSSSEASLARSNVRSKASAAGPVAVPRDSESMVKAIYSHSVAVRIASFKQGFSYSSENDPNLNEVWLLPAPNWAYFPLVKVTNPIENIFVKNGKSINFSVKNLGDTSFFTKDFLREFSTFRVDAIEILLRGFGIVVGETFYKHGMRMDSPYSQPQLFNGAELRDYFFRDVPEYSSYKIVQGIRPFFKKGDEGLPYESSDLHVVFMRDDWLDEPVFLGNQWKAEYGRDSSGLDLGVRKMSDFTFEKLSSYLADRETGVYFFIPYDLVKVSLLPVGVNKDSVEGSYIQNPVLNIVFDFNDLLHGITINDFKDDNILDEDGIYYKADSHVPFGISVRIINE